MGKFTPVPGLDEIVAEMVRPHVDDIIKGVAEVARKHAPDGKVWTSQCDSRVRPTHVEAHGQTVPANLRFTVTSMEWDMQHRGLGPTTFMLRPKDESSRAVVNLLNCRCKAVTVRDYVADMIRTEPARVEGTRVYGTVIAEGDQVLQAEYGDVYPFGLVSNGAFFMTWAVARARTTE